MTKAALVQNKAVVIYFVARRGQCMRIQTNWGPSKIKKKRKKVKDNQVNPPGTYLR